MVNISLTEIAGVAGLLFGLSGFILGVLNYFRDNPRVVVDLLWDLKVPPGTQYDSSKKWGTVRVSNIGRRPIYVSHVALEVPKGFDHTHMVLMEGISGKKLAEGDAPQTYMVSQDGMEIYAHKWRGIRAQVTDSSGKVWRSKLVARNSVPSWASRDRAR